MTEQELFKIEPNLYDYQIPDILNYCDKDKILNANRPGYGKTIEAITMLKIWKSRIVLIVCGKSLTLQWAKQLEQWWPDGCDGNGLRIMISPEKVQEWKEIMSWPRSSEKGTLVVIAKWDTLAAGCFSRAPNQRNKNARIFIPTARLERYKSVMWDCIVADEVHKIKNASTARAQALEHIPGVKKIGLTGTPILKHPDDLYSILHWLNPEYSGNSYWKFVYKYCNVVQTPFGKKIMGITKDRSIVQELRDKLEQFTIRNPERKYGKGKQIQTIQLEMYPAQRKKYNEIKQLELDELPDDCTIFNGMTHMLRLRQMTSNPQMFSPSLANPKVDYIKDFLDVDEDLKLVIFTCFARTTKMLMQSLKKYGIVSFIGEMSEKERDEAKQKFVQDLNVRVLVGTIGAMSEGVDGLQTVCHNAIFMDRDWSPGINEQAEDRLYRAGQEEGVMITYLECEKSVDQKVGRINLNKIKSVRELFD
jgi:hypothetical protein